MTCRHDVVASRDRDGKTVAGVRLSNRETRAWLYQDDYARILETGGSGPWFANRGNGLIEYVRTQDNTLRRVVTVAKLIAGDFARRVSYRDLNPNNLRSSNLKVSTAKRHA